jgi:hypothetical protein
MTMDLPFDRAFRGFVRRVVIEPTKKVIHAHLEDDMHCMSVSLHHDDGNVFDVQATTHRAPWTTCPQAVTVLKNQFIGVRIEEIASARGKRNHCTHLWDLAQFAAYFANRDKPICIDMGVTDPVQGVREGALWFDGQQRLLWKECDLKMLEPAAVAGLGLFEMTSWLDAQEGEAAVLGRMLRWVMIVAKGRTMPLEAQSDAQRMPPNCYSFQPLQSAQATRIVNLKDFSKDGEQPLVWLLEPNKL